LNILAGSFEKRLTHAAHSTILTMMIRRSPGALLLDLRVHRAEAEMHSVLFCLLALAAQDMSFYRNRIYPYLVSILGDPEPIKRVRQQIIASARGKVLEIGVGPGVNFALYDPAKVSKLFALEPNRGMIRLAEQQRRRTHLDIEFLELPGERIPLQDGEVDAVVSTFTLCTIPGVVQAISAIGRVLKPGGKFIFFEHGLSPDTRIEHWQRRTEPITRFVFEGCHVTRDIPSLITQGGFQIEQMKTGYLARFPKSWTYCFWGTAILKSP
jgi:SAM-dependent methyltransferase